ncbi:hypothetical protein LY76DRAFT_206304 [Colletotrichum caudatum]|nr:hypothetical protein LY76DRAFT_206304 [Colletotrichum caudatum]
MTRTEAETGSPIITNPTPISIKPRLCDNTPTALASAAEVRSFDGKTRLRFWPEETYRTSLVSETLCWTLGFSPARRLASHRSERPVCKYLSPGHNKGASEAHIGSAAINFMQCHILVCCSLLPDPSPWAQPNPWSRSVSEQSCLCRVVGHRQRGTRMHVQPPLYLRALRSNPETSQDAGQERHCVVLSMVLVFELAHHVHLFYCQACCSVHLSFGIRAETTQQVRLTSDTDSSTSPTWKAHVEESTSEHSEPLRGKLLAISSPASQNHMCVDACCASWLELSERQAH